MSTQAETTPLPTTIRKYPSLNGLRTLSVFLVIVSHFYLQTSLIADLEGNSFLRPFILLLRDGALGVNIFFLVSGFLITSLLMREERETKTVSLKGFYMRRTLRIFPAYFFVLGCYLIFQLAGYIHLSGESWFLSIFYLNCFGAKLDWYTSHFWSLSVEEHFYLFWPLIFVAGPVWRKRLAIGLVLIVPFIRTYDHLYNISWIHDLTIFTRIDAIALGCLVAIYQDTIVPFLARHWRKLFALSLGGLILLRSFKHLFEKVGLDFLYIPFGGSSGSIGNLFIAIIVMYSVFGPKGLWFKFLNLGFMNYLGVLSYGIYLWQQVFIHNSPLWVHQFPQNLVVMMIFVLFSFYCVERPFLKLKGRFSGKKAKPEKTPEPKKTPDEAGLQTPAAQG